MYDDAAPLQARPAPSRDRDTGRPLRILFAGYRSHPFVGGQGVYAQAVTAALADLGHHVEMVSGPPYPDLDPRVRLHKLPSLDLFLADNPLHAFRPSFLADWPDFAEWALHNTGAFGEPYAFAARLARWLSDAQHSYDVIHDNQGLAGPMRAIARHTPVAATLHHPITVDLRLALAEKTSFKVRFWLRRWHSFVEAQAKTARSLPALLAVSEAAKTLAVQDFKLDPARVLVAHNGVDPRVFHLTDRPREDTLIVATASSDIPLKGLDVLLDAFRTITQARPDLRLIVVGKLNRASLKTAFDPECAHANVRFVSNLANTEIAALYGRAALVIAPSRFEGFGLPAAEAMACGAPVLASDAGALPEVIGEAGLLFPSGDPDALARAALDLMAAPDERRALSAAGAARAQAAFCWKTHAKACLDMYSRAGVRAASIDVRADPC